MANFFAFALLCFLPFTLRAIRLPDQSEVDLKKIMENVKSLQTTVQKLQDQNDMLQKENFVVKAEVYELQKIVNFQAEETKEDVKNKTLVRTKRNAGIQANATFSSFSVGLCREGPAGRDGRDGRDGQSGLPGKDGITAEQLENILEKMLQANKQDINPLKRVSNSSSGAVFTRWGRTVCPQHSQLIYEGVMAGSHYSHSGGGANYLCLPRDPEWGRTTGGFESYGHLYGVEYEIYSNDPFSHDNTRGHALHDSEAVCAVCLATGRYSHVMIPAHQNCPAGWNKEYGGFVMAEAYTHHRSTYVCVDEAPQVNNGGVGDQNGALLYNIEGVCGALPCPPYVNGWELTCVVCTK